MGSLQSLGIQLPSCINIYKYIVLLFHDEGSFVLFMFSIPVCTIPNPRSQIKESREPATLVRVGLRLVKIVGERLGQCRVSFHALVRQKLLPMIGDTCCGGSSCQTRSPSHMLAGSRDAAYVRGNLVASCFLSYDIVED